MFAVTWPVAACNWRLLPAALRGGIVFVVAFNVQAMLYVLKTRSKSVVGKESQG